MIDVFGNSPIWVTDGIGIVLLIVFALWLIGGTFISLITIYRKYGSPTQAIEAAGVHFVETIDDSILDKWAEEQIIAGKLPASLNQVLDTIKNVVSDKSEETESTALKKLAQYLNDLTDGDIST